MSRLTSSVRNIPELFNAVEIGLDERCAVWFVLLYDVIVVAVEPAGVKSEWWSPQYVLCKKTFRSDTVHKKTLPLDEILQLARYALGLVFTSHSLFSCCDHGMDTLQAETWQQFKTLSSKHFLWKILVRAYKREIWGHRPPAFFQTTIKLFCFGAFGTLWPAVTRYKQIFESASSLSVNHHLIFQPVLFFPWFSSLESTVMEPDLALWIRTGGLWLSCGLERKSYGQ